MALNPPLGKHSVGELKHFGIAEIPKRRVGVQALCTIAAVEEKPSVRAESIEKRRTIAGRYVLTPDVFEVLRRTSPNRRTGKLELTDALGHFVKTARRLLGYQLSSPLVPLAPVRSMIELAIDSLEEPVRFASTLKQINSALTKSEKTF